MKLPIVKGKYGFFLLLLTAFFVSQATATETLLDASKSDVFLGILEDVPGVFAGEANTFHVRAVFQKNEEQWEPFPSQCKYRSCLDLSPSKYPAEVNWHITFDGRDLGQVKARTPDAFKFYGHVGLQEIISRGEVPKIGERTDKFAGWPGQPVYRPLVANSQPYFKDPESWKLISLSKEDTGLLRRQFRKKFPHLCMINKQDETKLEPFPYRNRDVMVVKTYGSKSGWIVARLHLSKAIECDDTGRGWEINDQWFALNPNKSGQFLDEGIVLVDAGDYDNSGKDTLVFSIDRYDEGGYELYYDDFRKHAVFTFHYH